MTAKELRSMKVKIRGYGMPDDNAPDFYTRCVMIDALEIIKNVVKDYPKKFSNLTFEIYTEDEEGLFAIHRDLEEIYLGDNIFNLTKDMIREALGILNENIEVLILGFPDSYDDDYLDYVHHCALKDSLFKMNKHLDELNLDRRGRLGYQFSVLLVGDKGGHKLVYSYSGDREIITSKEFEDVLNFIE